MLIHHVVKAAIPMSMLPTLKSIPLISIYCFVSKAHNCVYICHSTSSVLEIAKNIDELARGVHKSRELCDMYANDPTLELIVLKGYTADTSPYTVRAEHGFVVDDWVSRGYRNMRDDYNAGDFRLRPQVLTWPDSGLPLYFVIAESKRKERLVLGVFETIPEGKEWVESVFPDKDRVIPVFHNNKRTKAYHAEFGLKLKT